MLVKILSDLHLDAMQNDQGYVDHGERVCILAGDISEGMRGINWALANIPYHIEVLYVPGNHEYYGHDYVELQRNFEIHNQQDTHVTVLDNTVVDIRGVKFAGTTLWTDFQLYSNPSSPFQYERGLNDCTWIKFAGRKLKANDVINLNTQAMDFLSHISADVLITHYGPQFSESPQWMGHPLTPGFLTKIPSEIHSKFKYHIHGHTHTSFDYELPYGTRVICNPQGNNAWENAHFNGEKVINI